MPPTTTTLLDLERCDSAETASSTPKLLFEAGAISGLGSGFLDSRFSSRFGNGTGVISGAIATGLKGSATGAPEPFERAGAVAAAVVDDVVAGLMTTGGKGAGTAGGLGGAAGGPACASSLGDLRSFCNKPEIWSAMVFSTATCVMVKA